MPNNQEFYRSKILPALAILETIATKGRSPGTTALGQEEYFQGREQQARQADIDEQERRYKQALIRKIEQEAPESLEDVEIKRRLAQQRLKKEEAEFKEQQEHSAFERDFRERYGKAPLPEEQEKIYEEFLGGK